jgi:hypothetical protein
VSIIIAVIALMTDPVRTSETSLNSCKTTRCNVPEVSSARTRCFKNPKSLRVCVGRFGSPCFSQFFSYVPPGRIFHFLSPAQCFLSAFHFYTSFSTRFYMSVSVILFTSSFLPSCISAHLLPSVFLKYSAGTFMARYVIKLHCN